MRITKFALAVLWFAGAYALVGAGQEILAASLMLAHCFAILAALKENSDGGALPSSPETTNLIFHLSDVTTRIEKLIDISNEMRQALLDNNIHRAWRLECEALRAELASWQKAFGLLTTLHGSMPIDISDPLRMAKSIEGHVRAELAKVKRDVEIVRFLRCGGWEVLQNPKYWTLENKFYGAIAEAMAEVAAEGDKNGDA